MSKNKQGSLTPREQDVYFALSNKKNRVFTIGMASGFWLGSREALRVVLSAMAKKGWLTRLKRGTYQLNEPGVSSMEDVFSAATYMFNGYIAFSSAPS